MFYAAFSIVFGVLAVINPVLVRKAIEGEWLLILCGVLAVVICGWMSAPVLGLLLLWYGAGVLQIFVAFRIHVLVNEIN